MVKVVELVGAVLSENAILDELRSECIYVQGLAKQLLSIPLKETDTLFTSNIEIRANYPKFSSLMPAVRRSLAASYVIFSTLIPLTNFYWAM